jgi:hypothetical protein
MHWEIWLVPLIALAVWILGSLLRGGVEEPPRNDPQPNGGGPVRGRPPQRPMTDLDRFLQEVHRRRQGGEQHQTELPEMAPPPQRAERQPAPARAMPTPTRQPPRRPPRPTTPPVKRTPRGKPAEAIVVRLPVAEPAKQLEQVVPEVVALSPATVPTPPPPPPPPAVAGPPPSLATLLSTPEGLRNAFILREILAPPLCKRQS